MPRGVINPNRIKVEKRVLNCLKKKESSFTVEDIKQATKQNTKTVGNILMKFDRLGLVMLSTYIVHGGRGRPSKLYVKTGKFDSIVSEMSTKAQNDEA